MRILHTEWSEGWGGQERRVMADLVGMAARGHAMHLATRPHARIATEARAAGITVITLPMRGNADLASVARLAAYLRRHRIQVVNTHSGVDTWIGSLAAKLARVPALVRTRHLHLPLKRRWSNFVHFLPDTVITCGQAMQQLLVRECGFPEDRVVSIPTGIDFPRFTSSAGREATRQALGIDANAFVVLMVGIIRGVKRHEVALRAFEKFSRDGRNTRLLLAGEGPMRPDMERLAKELGIAEQVIFLGHREDIPDLMAAADVLLLTSRSEGIPQAISQALGVGLPVVATRVGGVPELIETEVTGLLVPPEDAGAVAAALQRVAADPEAAKGLAERGQRHALSRLSLQAMLDRTEDEYRRLLAKAPRHDGVA
jgi:glycosyltransferase involved in cell wall biosynthesis